MQTRHVLSQDVMSDADGLLLVEVHYHRYYGAVNSMLTGRIREWRATQSNE